MSHSTPEQARITSEEDIASYLISNPEFFERFAEVLGSVQLGNPHGGKTVSLQERQALMLREKIKGLEATVVEMMGYGSENAQILQKAHSWTAAMLKERDHARLPSVLTAQLKILFGVPQAFLRLWDLDAAYTLLPEVQRVNEVSKGHIATLSKPYCGPRGSVEGLKELAGEDANLAAVQSIAIIPLRAGAVEESRITFGYLLLASPDSHRFTQDMGVDLLIRLGELGSASMQRLLPSETLAWLHEQEQAAAQAHGQAELPLEEL